MSSALLELRDVVKLYPVRGSGRKGASIRAVDGVDLAIPAGRVFGLVGESGSGKTTVARCILGLTPLSEGSIEFDGVDLSAADRRARRALHRQIQLVFQQPAAALDPRMTVDRLIAEPLTTHGLARGAALRERVARLLDDVGLLAGPPAPVPARALGRTVPAGRDRASAGDRSPPGRSRRADLGARHRRAGPDPQPARRAARPARAHVSAHLPRPVRRPSPQRPDRRDVPREGRRGGARGGAARRPPPPLHAGAAREHARPWQRVPRRAGSPRGRAAVDLGASDRLPLPSPVRAPREARPARCVRDDRPGALSPSRRITWRPAISRMAPTPRREGLCQ